MDSCGGHPFTFQLPYVVIWLTWFNSRTDALLQVNSFYYMNQMNQHKMCIQSTLMYCKPGNYNKVLFIASLTRCSAILSKCLF